jgi:hypothetical protein
MPLIGREDQHVVIAHVAEAIDRLRLLAPLHVRAGLAILEAAFGMMLAVCLWPSPRSARARALLGGLHRIPGPWSALFRFYGSLTGLASYEHPIILRALGVEPGEARASRLRDARLAGLRVAK